MSVNISESAQDITTHDMKVVNSQSSTGSQVTEMDINADLGQPHDSLHLDQKMTELNTPAIFHCQHEISLPANNSVKDMGIAITTNTAQLLSPFSSTVSSAYYCPFPLPSRTTSLRASTSIMTKVPPPVPPKDLKKTLTLPATPLPSQKKYGLQQTSMLRERKKRSIRGKSKHIRKRFQGVFNKKLKQDFHYRKSTITRVKEGMCSLM